MNVDVFQLRDIVAVIDIVARKLIKMIEEEG